MVSNMSRQKLVFFAGYWYYIIEVGGWWSVGCRVSRHVFYACVYSADRSSNFRARIKGLTFYVLGILLPLLLFVNLFARSMSKDVLDSLLGSSGTETLLLYLVSQSTLVLRFVGICYSTSMYLYFYHSCASDSFKQFLKTVLFSQSINQSNQIYIAPYVTSESQLHGLY